MPTTESSRQRLCAAIYFALALVTLAVYWPLSRHDFINLDDQQYITSNAQVQSGLTWANVVWAFKTSEAANWHPLTWLSHMMDCDLWRPQSRRASSDQPALSHRQHIAALFSAQTVDRRFMAQFFCRRAFRLASAARRIGRLGCGTQGCLERIILMLTLIVYVRATRKGGRRSKAESRAQKFRLSTFGLRPSTISWLCSSSPAG